MSDLNLLYIVTAVVLGGLVIWVLVVLFTAKDAPDESPDPERRGGAGDAPGSGPDPARPGPRDERKSQPPRAAIADVTPPPSSVEVSVKSERSVEIAGRSAPVVVLPVMRQRLDSHSEIRDDGSGEGTDASAAPDAGPSEAPSSTFRDSMPPVSGQPLSLVSAVGLSEPTHGSVEVHAVVDRHRLFILADGGGQRVQNELVSAVVVNALAAAFEVDEDVSAPADPNLPRRADRLRRAVLAAGAILRTRGTPETLDPSRVSVLAAHFAPDNRHLYIVTAGPDRAYRLRGADLVHLNKPSLAPGATAAQGATPARVVDTLVAETAPDDLYVFGSDSAFLALGDELRTVLAVDPSIERVAAHFVEAATRGGRSTGMTAIAVRVNAPRPSARP